MYADFDYYTKEYGGKVIGSADDFNHYARKAKRRIDTITTNKLRFAFPTDDNAVMAVKECFCELADFLYQVDICKSAAMDSFGVVSRSDGTVTGKMVTSISSGSESIGFSAGTYFEASDVIESAKDPRTKDTNEKAIIRGWLAYIPNANGVNLLYAGL